MISDFYYRKFVQWENDPRYRYYGDYVRANRNDLAQEFHDDPAFRDICNFVRSYAEGEKASALKTIVSESISPEQDVLNILVAATLSACGYPDLAESILGLVVGGIIGAAAIAIVASLLSKK
ncbi:MAG: hypothetical protein M1327_04335 [Candidatus Thermoplasmatota archaeon]|nr:hypothetical protein [Candidatus Thermoplasmatota archaeon]